MHSIIRRTVLIAGGVFWAFSIGLGILAMTSYETTPGELVEAPARWPEASTVVLTEDSLTLIMLAHPQCPCTKATISELERLLGQLDQKIKTYVIFIKPEGTSEEWVKSSLVAGARAIPGVIVITDENGAEADRFHARTSGQTVLYDQKGELIFRGGITGARGQTGSNDGSRSIISLVNSQTAALNETPVFGCPLFDAKRKNGDECHGGDHR